MILIASLISHFLDFSKVCLTDMALQSIQPNDLVLAIDASLKKLTLVLLKNDQMLQSFVGDDGQQHSTYLLKSIDHILKLENQNWSSLQHIVFTSGPGGFTSLRVCFATVMGLAIQNSIQVHTASSLYYRCLALTKERKGRLGCLVRAGRGKVYYGILNHDEEPIFEEGVLSLDDAVTLLLKKQPFSCLGGEGLGLVSLGDDFAQTKLSPDDPCQPKALKEMVSLGLYQSHDLAQIRLQYGQKPEIGPIK